MKNINIISDFNLENLRILLANKDKETSCNILGEVQYGINNPKKADLCFFWIRPHAIFENFNLALQFQEIDVDILLDEVDNFAKLVCKHADNSRIVAISSWYLEPSIRGYGILDWRNEFGLSNLIARMNLKLVDSLSHRNNIFILDSSKWFINTTNEILQLNETSRLWYAAKIPYSSSVIKKAANEIERLEKSLSGQSRRLIILDLDGTIWGNEVGEVGWKDIVLGGHDMIGEAFVQFQKDLKYLTNYGIQLAIVSKNDEKKALEAIDNNGSMILRKNDFAGWRINWNDKALNIQNLLKELNLTPDFSVFIDNEPSERDRVRLAFPKILVPEWPEDPCLYSQYLRNLCCFDLPTISKEDRKRLEMYNADKERYKSLNESKIHNISNNNEWLKNINMILDAELLCEKNLARATQLFNKTNQMNLKTRRMTEDELLLWNNQVDQRIWTFSLKDKFGDMGLIGLISARMCGSLCIIEDFLISCRVIGRGIENGMIFTLAKWAEQKKATSIQAEYIPTEKNIPMLNCLKSFKPIEVFNNVFQYSIKNIEDPTFFKLNLINRS